MDLQPADILIYIINIGILYVLLRLLLYKPIRKFLDARTERIKGDLQAAEVARAEAEAVKASLQESLDGAQTEAERILQKSSAEAQSSAESRLSQAQTEAANIIAKAQDEAQRIRENAIADLQPQIALLATQIAEQILGREVSREDNQHLVDEHFARLFAEKQS